jgi:hypothetical protein
MVYDFINQARAGFLLPMRIAGFNKLLQLIEKYISININDIPLPSQP